MMLNVTITYEQDDKADFSYLGAFHDADPGGFSLQTLFNYRPLWFTPAWNTENVYQWHVNQGYTSTEAYSVVVAQAKEDMNRLLDFYMGKWNFIGVVATAEAEGVVLARQTLWNVESDISYLEDIEQELIGRTIQEAEDAWFRLTFADIHSYAVIKE